ncbi:MFS transporter [Janibacter terrae]|uniref:MFS transporter n=1 Tax=Janibacter terrae TaxID=103817 RepID=UPI0031F724AD
MSNETVTQRPQSTEPSTSGVMAWSMTGLVILLYMVNYADKAVYGIIAQPLARELGLTSAEIGLVGSIFFLLFTLGGFSAGLIKRVAGLRWALAGLAIVWAASVLPVVLAAGFATLIVSRAILGVAEGPSSALMHTAVYSWHAPDKRGFPSAMLLGAISLAKIIFAPLLTWVTIQHGWRAALIVMSIFAIVWSVLWLTTWREGSHSAPKVANAAGDTSIDRVPWSRILLSPSFVFGGLLFASYYALQTVILTWLPSYFELGLGYSAQEAGSMFALPSMVALVVMLGGSKISDRLMSKGASVRSSRVYLAAGAVVIGGALFALVPYVQTPVLVVALVSFAYGIASLAAPLLNTAVSAICPPQQLAGTLGVFLAIMSIGGLVAPYAAGVIVDNASSEAVGFATSFQILGGVALLFALLALVFMRPDADRERLVGAPVGGSK